MSQQQHPHQPHPRRRRRANPKSTTGASVDEEEEEEEEENDNGGDEDHHSEVTVAGGLRGQRAHHRGEDSAEINWDANATGAGEGGERRATNNGFHEGEMVGVVVDDCGGQNSDEYGFDLRHNDSPLSSLCDAAGLDEVDDDVALLHLGENGRQLNRNGKSNRSSWSSSNRTTGGNQKGIKLNSNYHQRDAEIAFSRPRTGQSRSWLSFHKQRQPPGPLPLPKVNDFVDGDQPPGASIKLNQGDREWPKVRNNNNNDGNLEKHINWESGNLRMSRIVAVDDDNDVDEVENANEGEVDGMSLRMVERTRSRRRRNDALDESESVANSSNNSSRNKSNNDEANNRDDDGATGRSFMPTMATRSDEDSVAAPTTTTTTCVT